MRRFRTLFEIRPEKLDYSMIISKNTIGVFDPNKSKKYVVFTNSIGKSLEVPLQSCEVLTDCYVEIFDSKTDIKPKEMLRKFRTTAGVAAGIDKGIIGIFNPEISKEFVYFPSINDHLTVVHVTLLETCLTHSLYEEVTQEEKPSVIPQEIKETFIRDDSEKLDWTLLDWEALEECAKVLEFGKKKYSRDNWKLLPPEERFTRILPSMMRHVIAIANGEEIDPESGLSHAGHIMCNAMFWQNKLNREKENIKGIKIKLEGKDNDD
jgi:Domain of unknown function (DUF5664)